MQVILWGGGRHAYVNIFWTIQIILDTFWLSFCTLSSDLFWILDSVRSDHISDFTILIQINKCMYIWEICPKISNYQMGRVFFNTLYNVSSSQCCDMLSLHMLGKILITCVAKHYYYYYVAIRFHHRCVAKYYLYICCFITCIVKYHVVFWCEVSLSHVL